VYTESLEHTGQVLESFLDSILEYASNTPCSEHE